MMEQRETIALASVHDGVYPSPMIWAVQHGFFSDAVLLILASAEYSPDEYIRDYQEFQRITASNIATPFTIVADFAEH